jgi:type III secretion protein W
MVDFNVDPSSEIHGLSGSHRQERIAAQKLKQYLVSQKISREEARQWMAEEVFSLPNIQRRFKALDKRIKRGGSSTEDESEAETSVKTGEKKILRVKNVGQIADFFNKRNEELEQDLLLQLLDLLSAEDTPDDVMEKISRFFDDPSIQDEVLDFLMASTDEHEAEKLRRAILAAKERLNAQQGRAVKAGKNILKEAQKYAQIGVGTPTQLRNLYRDITGNPREPNALFEELSEKYVFDQLKFVIGFLLHSIGSDLNSKGPSIERAELIRLFAESRILQAILGVYLFFKGRLRILQRSFQKYGVSWNTLLGFETLAKIFMRYIKERYPSAEKVLRLAADLGLEDELMAQVITFTQFRDAVKQISPRLYRSDQHKLDIFSSIIDALESIEDEMEEEYEKEEEEEQE